MTDTREFRRHYLSTLTTDPAVIDELLAYTDSPLAAAARPASPVFPLADEGHLPDWRQYHAAAGTDPFAALQAVLVQLRIPVRAGMSKTDAYARVARGGEPFNEQEFGGQLRLERPDQFEFSIHDHPAGALPVLFTPHRPDFATLYRALGARSETVVIPPSVNAVMVAGLINWSRVGRYRSAWSADQPGGDWDEELARVDGEEPWRFRDRLILLGDAPYSGVSAAALGLEMGELAWRAASARLRLEHEFTHYATKRLFNSMRNNLLDELIADFMGLTLVLKDFRAEWFLHFLGLEEFPAIRPGGRIEAYRAALGPAAFALLGRVATDAVRNLAEAFRAAGPEPDRAAWFLALTRLTIDELAAGRKPDLRPV